MKILINQVDNASCLDPSEYRPETKSESEFRNFENTEHLERIKRTYSKMHTFQTVRFVEEMHEKWCQFNHAEMTIMEACFLLDNLIDECDPDLNLPNSVHAFQTAEKIREAHPDREWFILVGLIHDLGKIMALYGEEQWAVVGDTYPVGCPPTEEIVFGVKSFAQNVDLQDPVYSQAPFGKYSPNIGLDNVTMIWGHDEYMYRVLQENSHKLPEEALYMIRYHSFYPWHTSGQYHDLCSQKDMEMMKWVLEFNKFDLYSKSSEILDVQALIPYYQSLIDKYIPGVIRW